MSVPTVDGIIREQVDRMVADASRGHTNFRLKDLMHRIWKQSWLRAAMEGLNPEFEKCVRSDVTNRARRRLRTLSYRDGTRVILAQTQQGRDPDWWPTAVCTRVRLLAIGEQYNRRGKENMAIAASLKVLARRLSDDEMIVAQLDLWEAG